MVTFCQSGRENMPGETTHFYFPHREINQAESVLVPKFGIFLNYARKKNNFKDNNNKKKKLKSGTIQAEHKTKLKHTLSISTVF